jgi:hypothetical protein
MLFAQKVRVPFVGCPSTGQLDDIEAPQGTAKRLRIGPSAARRLAYYQGDVVSGILAPRGWQCHGNNGSAGEELLVSPTPASSNGNGAGVMLDHISAAAFGRFAVADVIARVFPSKRAFVQAMIDGGDVPPNGFTFGPYPTDKIVVQTNQLVQFETPPRAAGLGSGGYFTPNDDPIDGVAILEGRNPDLLILRVRLPRELRDLAPVIIRDLLIRQRGDTR